MWEHIPPDVLALTSKLWEDNSRCIVELTRRFLVKEFPRARPSVELNHFQKWMRGCRARRGIFLAPPRVSWPGLVALAEKAAEIPDLDPRLMAAVARVLKLEKRVQQRLDNKILAREEAKEEGRRKLRETLEQMK
jgi:hypothetical protein